MRAALVVLLAAVATPSAQARNSLQAIDACVASLAAQPDSGYARIAARCPELTPALTQSPWGPWLPRDWNRADNELSAGALTELRALLVRADAPAAERHAAPQTGRLPAILASIAHSEDARLSWWLRLKDWLRRILAPRAAPDSTWLRRVLATVNLSGTGARLITWAALALVVALAAGVMINELRVAGLLRGRSGRGRVQDPRSGAAGPVPAGIDEAAQPQQPGLLLERITLRLAEQDRLPPARALTGRELLQRAHLDDERGHARLAQLLSVCEHVRFSGREVGAASLGAAIESGRLLLATLEAPATRPPRGQPS